MACWVGDCATCQGGACDCDHGDRFKARETRYGGLADETPEYTSRTWEHNGQTYTWWLAPSDTSGYVLLHVAAPGGRKFTYLIPEGSADA